MYTEPITERLRKVLDQKDTIVKLVEYGWTDGAIANYLSSDKITIKRAKELYMQIKEIRKPDRTSAYYQKLI